MSTQHDFAPIAYYTRNRHRPNFPYNRKYCYHPKWLLYVVFVFSERKLLLINCYLQVNEYEQLQPLVVPAWISDRN